MPANPARHERQRDSRCHRAHDSLLLLEWDVPVAAADRIVDGHRLAERARDAERMAEGIHVRGLELSVRGHRGFDLLHPVAEVELALQLAVLDDELDVHGGRAARGLPQVGGSAAGPFAAGRLRHCESRAQEQQRTEAQFHGLFLSHGSGDCLEGDAGDAVRPHEDAVGILEPGQDDFPEGLHGRLLGPESVVLGKQHFRLARRRHEDRVRLARHVDDHAHPVDLVGRIAELPVGPEGAAAAHVDRSAVVEAHHRGDIVGAPRRRGRDAREAVHLVGGRRGVERHFEGARLLGREIEAQEADGRFLRIGHRSPSGGRCGEGQAEKSYFKNFHALSLAQDESPTPARISAMPAP